MAREEENKVKLLGLWSSPFVHRVEWALKLKGVSYGYVEEDILSKSPLLLELNPVHKTVPVMVHDGRIICELLMILEYLDETWKHKPLMPQDLMVGPQPGSGPVLSTRRKMARDEENKVKLVGLWVSPYVHRVEWALKLKGVSYDYVEEDVWNKSPLLLELNPVHKKVPVMVHDGKVICESLMILEYIDETWKHKPLMPQDPYGRATARFWASFVEDKPIRNCWIAMCFDGEEKEKGQEVATEAVERLEEQLSLNGKKFFGGDDIGYLDFAVAWIAYLLPVWEEIGAMKIVDPSRFPLITAWAKSFSDHPVIRDNLPPKDKMLDYFRGKREEFRAARAQG